ncbi:MAG: hypothetical protein RIT45_1326 [Pseudomonadota bacterium]|jgi:hypothetical protein
MGKGSKTTKMRKRESRNKLKARTARQIEQAKEAARDRKG